jgi:hypothetical protein
MPVKRGGAARGAFARSSMNGIGWRSPCAHQPRIMDARRGETLKPVDLACPMPMTGKRGLVAVLAIGVRQQSVYQRKI